MSIYYFKTEQFLNVDINTAWNFFSSAKNLALITPPEMAFNILTTLDDKEIYEGMLIDYTVKPLLGIPVRWQTEICKVERPIFFTDRQVKGPYKLWEHTHTYTEKDNGVLMQVEIKYQLPFGLLGNIVHSLVVRKKIEEIFKFRTKILTKMFVAHGNDTL